MRVIIEIEPDIYEALLAHARRRDMPLVDLLASVLAECADGDVLQSLLDDPS